MNASDKKARPQDRYDKKNGLISKSYKISRETAEAFQNACKVVDVSMGAQLTSMMQDFIQQVEQEKK